MDYFIYDRANDHVLLFETSNDVIIYSDKNEAYEDLYANEEVVTFKELPSHWQETITKQLKG